jgi:hypothetical protein
VGSVSRRNRSRHRSAPRHGGYHNHIVAVMDGCVEPTTETDIVVIQVIRNEWVGIARLIEEPRSEGREAGRDFGHRSTHRGAVSGDLALAVREPGEDGGEMDRD